MGPCKAYKVKRPLHTLYGLFHKVAFLLSRRFSRPTFVPSQFQDMKKVFYPAGFAALLFVFSCGSKPAGETPATPETPKFEMMEKAKWLIGEWGSVMPEGSTTETWEAQNDSVYVGRTYFVAGKDTLFSESISIEQRGKDLFYIPVVKGQNGGKPVEFKLTSSTEKRLVFENPTHDFPQKITYTRQSTDSLVAEISGTDKGKAAAERFVMGRMK